MADHDGSLAAASAEADAGTNGVDRPRVVVLVRGDVPDAAGHAPPPSAPRDLANLETTKMTPAELAKIRAARDASTADTRKLAPPSRPTPAAPPRPPRVYGPEDDRLIAAVIQIDLDSEPSPLTDFLGASLLHRATHAAAAAGAPRLILVVRSDLAEDRRRELHRLAQEGFAGGAVEVTDRDPDELTLGRGRVLALDGAALHDPEAVARLARVRGDKVALLLGPAGEGLRVRTESGVVHELGADVTPSDGMLIGALSAPSADFARLSQIGMSAAMDELRREGRLIGQVAPRTHARQFAGPKLLERARREAFEALASSGSDGLFDDLIGRPLSRGITLRLLHQDRITPAFVSAVAGVLAIAGAALLAVGGTLGAIVAGLLLIASAVLDRTDGELARLRLEPEQRSLDFFLDHVTQGLVALGLAFGVHNPAPGVAGWQATLDLLRFLPEGWRSYLQANVTPLPLGFLTAGGVVLLLLVLLWRGKPQPGSRGLRKLGDALASSFGSRDYFYLLFGVALLHALWPQLGLMGAFLLASAVAVHLCWASLGLITLLAPPQRGGQER